MPIIVGGSGPTRTPTIAARYATEFNIGFQPEAVIGEKFDNVRRICVEQGRDPQSLKLSVALPTLVGADERALATRAKAAGTTIDEMRDDVNIVGSADEVTAKVERLAALGAERVYFQLMDMRDLDQLEYLGTEVLPQLPR